MTCKAKNPQRSHRVERDLGLLWRHLAVYEGQSEQTGEEPGLRGQGHFSRISFTPNSLRLLSPPKTNKQTKTIFTALKILNMLILTFSNVQHLSHHKNHALCHKH